MFDMWGGNAPVDPAGFDDAAELERAVTLARDADVAVLVLGEWQNMIGEAASRSSIELPGRQLELLQAVVATGTPTVLLVMSDAADLRWATENVGDPRHLVSRHPGRRGRRRPALRGRRPGEELPFSWPRTVGQVPMIYSHDLARTQQADRRYWDEQAPRCSRSGTDCPTAASSTPTSPWTTAASRPGRPSRCRSP